jgi:putative hydrolase of the HAD superfamily
MRGSVDRAVLFDFGGTLDADGVPWKERFYRLFAGAGVDVGRERFDPIFYRADDALVGGIPETQGFADTVAQLAAGVTEALCPGDRALASRVAAQFLEKTAEQIEKNRPLLTRLAERYRLGIVSNFYGNLETVCDDFRLRRLFPVILDSTRVGLSKPDPRMFRRAAEELGVPVESAVFVGDSLPRDMGGALAAGMRHVWLAGSGPRDATPCCADDRVVRSLLEVEAVLSEAEALR